MKTEITCPSGHIEEVARIRAEGERKKAIAEATITSPVKGGSDA